MTVKPLMNDSRIHDHAGVESPVQKQEGWRANLGRTRMSLLGPRPDDWWTGKAPGPDPLPGQKDLDRPGSLPIPRLDTCARQGIRDYFDMGWTLTELLFSALQTEEAFYRPPYHGLRHPLIFYYVHPATFYINKLRVAGLIEDPVNSYFESLFETGVDEMSWDDMSKNEIEWPTLDNAHAYRRKVYGTVAALIERHPGLAEGHADIDRENPLWALFMGMEHERIHIETTSVLIRELPLRLVARPASWPPDSPLVPSVARPAAGVDFPANAMVAVTQGRVSLGKPQDHPTYGWDNEYGKRSAAVGPFKASRFLISNGEFLEFVADGGYSNARFWSKLGWKWRVYRNAKWPVFWVPDGPAGSHLYKLRTCFEVVPMQWAWPAVVNYHEAKAYCRWKTERDRIQGSFRLLSENEHHRLRDVTASESPPSHPAPVNLALRKGSEGPVDEQAPFDLPFCDVFGNVWQWCEDHFNPLPGAKVHRYYDDFSTPCYDGEHQMILGGSFISTGDEATSYARFHFRPHFFQHAGFRTVHSPTDDDGGRVSIEDRESLGDRYEKNERLSAYLLLHYGSRERQMPFDQGPAECLGFPQRVARLVMERCSALGIGKGSALDIGCGVGGAVFELAKGFDQVTGIDLSAKFIEAAQQIKDAGNLSYEILEEGELHTTTTASVPEDLRQKVLFRRADACSLPPEFIDFDAVLVANVLCRLPSPTACLNRLGGSRGVVKKGGLLVLTTPFTWRETFTPMESWLGGFVSEDGTPQWSFDGLKGVLADEFELLETRDMPFLIREHRRMYHYIVAQTSIWRRRTSCLSSRG